MTDQITSSPPGGWWVASDGKWYPPEQHPNYVPPAPAPIGISSLAEPQNWFASPPATVPRTWKSNWVLWVGLAVLIVACGVVGLVIGASGGTQVRSASATSTTVNQGPALASLYQQFSTDLVTETAANHAFYAASTATQTDIGKQEQRIQQDQAAYNAGLAGTGCDPSDLGGYATCVEQDDSQAAAAASDQTAAQGQVQTDNEQFASASSTYQGALSTFIGQVLALPWPSGLSTAEAALLSTSRQFRDDLAQGGAIATTASAETVSGINAQLSTDVGNFNDAANATRAAFAQLGVAGTAGQASTPTQ
jgi:hypothetical protein